MSDATTVSEASDDEPPKTTQTPTKRLRAFTLRSDPIELFQSSEGGDSHKRSLVRPLKVERKQAKRPRRSAARKDSSSDDDDDEEDASVDELPDYLRARRTAFERRRAKLHDAGLRLPPEVGDVSFSGVEQDVDIGSLKERPDFPAATATPVRPYEDISLQNSLGVIPAAVVRWLRDYQVEGAAFLHRLFVQQTGGILGDDMGLGKTVQVIAFLTAAFGKTGDERDKRRMRRARRDPAAPWYPRVLIVCPGSLIENWRAEFGRWGWWHIEIYHGEAKEAALQASAAGRAEILITTYSTYRDNRGHINMIAWDCVVADECHTIKGRRSMVTRAMNEVNALCRIGLTGTAIQNSYDELWTLLNWTNPGAFGPLADWQRSISEPLRRGQSHAANMHELGRARKTAKALTENLLPRFFLRRVKALIASQLPKKTDRVVFCPMTDTQAEAYKRFLDSEIIERVKTSADPCACGSGKKSGWCCHAFLENGIEWQRYIFPAIQNLCKMANHLAILIPQDQDPRDKQEKDIRMLSDALPDRWQELVRTRGSILHYSDAEFCGKWKVLKRLLRFWHESGDKVLVFSHSVRLLRMLRALFQSTTAYSVSLLEGAMGLEERARAVDTFNADPQAFVFLISTRAGGVGLNITAANKVVIFDPNWNPAHDLQAQDRAYRIGQARDVDVFRLVSAGTIEEIVYARQVYKQQQANIGYTASDERRYFTGIQQNKDRKGEIFGLANLFAYQGENIVLRDIVNKTNVAESRAGVAVADFDLSPEGQRDDENNHLFSSKQNGSGEDGGTDAALSQLAKMVAQGKTNLDAATSKNRKRAHKSDPVQAILAQAGVQYTHENSEVVGSSKVEARLSRKAEASDTIGAGKQHAFVQPGDRPALSARGPAGNSDTAGIDWRYNPPDTVKKRQFCTMADTFGFENVTQFALAVEGWTQAQRRSCLDKFYAIRRQKLGLTGSNEASETDDEL